MLQSITSYLNNATHLNQAQIFVVCEFKRNIIKRKEHSLDCSKCRDKSYSIVEIKKFIQEEPSLEQSRIRFIDLGIQIKIDQQYNYFRHINPRKKKTILQILDAYIDNLAQEETKLLQDALSIYFDNTYQGKEMENLICGEKDQPEPLLCHIYSFMIFDRLSSHYARYEYLDQFKIIEYFNQRDKVFINLYIYKQNLSKNQQSQECVHFPSNLTKFID
ncbi:unnamed protein product [Paramecium pentaurelia]|uniref:Uncharacterized protein n=1 Tax=Paramecium pentaurelia TaxID=43138 RepID=A0A8S1WF85_9CILI|nr:unnamed protein product [Paramecium pentaurelia]